MGSAFFNAFGTAPCRVTFLTIGERIYSGGSARSPATQGNPAHGNGRDGLCLRGILSLRLGSLTLWRANGGSGLSHYLPFFNGCHLPLLSIYAAISNESRGCLLPPCVHTDGGRNSIPDFPCRNEHTPRMLPGHFSCLYGADVSGVDPLLTFLLSLQ